MTVFLLLNVLLVVDDGRAMCVSGLAAHLLWIGMADSLWMCNFFLTGSSLGCCGGCDGLDMG